MSAADENGMTAFPAATRAGGTVRGIVRRNFPGLNVGFSECL